MARNHRPPSPKNSFEERLRQREASNKRRAKLVAALRLKSEGADEAGVEEPPRHLRDGDAFLQSLNEMPFYRVGESVHRELSDGYVELMRAAIRTMNTGNSEVLLWWPAHQPCLSALASLLALAETAAVARQSG